MTTTYKFNGHLTAEAPLQVTYKDSTTSSDSVRRLPRNGSIHTPAYFPATSIRGALRYAMHKVVLRAAKSSANKEKPFSLANHFMLAQGVDITNQVVDRKISEGEISFSDNLRTTNPALSLFGRWRLASKLGIGSAIPTTENCVVMHGGGARSIMFERNEDLLKELTDNDIDNFKLLLIEQAQASLDINEVKTELGEEKRKLKKISDSEGKQVIFERVRELENQIKQIKANKTVAREAIRRPLDSFEVFAQGTRFNHRMTLVQGTNIELALMLASVREFARDPHLGGKRSLGLGEISAYWDVSVWEADDDSPQTIGTIKLSNSGFEITGDRLNTALELWDKAKNNLQEHNIDFTEYLEG